MKFSNLVGNGFIILSLMIATGILIINPTTAFVPWGIVADDGSAIQPFTTSRTTGKDFRIPQDQDTLALDHFYVYLEWRGSQTQREFIIQLHEEKEREIIVGETSYIETFWEVRAEIVVQMIKGSNEWQDSRFALKTIDSSVLSDFKKAESREKVIILYRNLEIEFFHKTSYAEIEQTKTVQQWNIEAIILALWTIFLGFVSGGASKFILDKATYVPDLPHWSIWILVFLFIFVASILFFLISGYNLDEVLRVILLVPAPVISIFFAIYFMFWLAARFRPSKLREFLFIILDLPNLKDVRTGKRRLRDENELPCDAAIMEGYINKDGAIELIDDPQSYWEMIRRVKLGGIKFNIKKFGKRIRIRQRKKIFDDIIFCEKFEKQDLDVKIKSGALWSLSSVIIIIGIFTWIFPLFFNFASITTSILGTLFILVGALYFIWENIDIAAPVVNITPITNRSSIEIIRDKLSLDMKDDEISKLEISLYQEKSNLAEKSRIQTMKALAEVEDSVLPIKEIAEGELDIEDLPEPIQKFVKSWVEKWESEKSLGDIKEIVEHKKEVEKK